MIKAIKDFAKKFGKDTHIEMRLRPSSLSYYNIAEYAKVKEKLLEEGFELTKRGERCTSTFHSKETWIAEYEKDGIELDVWYEKFQAKEERCAELRRELEELRCGE